ncbi:MAG: hypothetical protein H6729_16740 [Deltaproteobacteria bacterium]|nr:hypothetical protein [Deltaproteobacteria bacterium]
MQTTICQPSRNSLYFASASEGIRHRAGLGGMTDGDMGFFAVRQAAHPNPLDYATRLELAFGVAAKPLRRGGLELSHKEALAYAESAAAGEKEFRETQRRLELADTIGQVYLTASRALDRGGLGLSRKDAGDFAQRLVLAHEALSEDDLALLVDALATKRLGGDEAGRTRAAPPTVDELVASAGEALKTSSSTNDIAPSSLAQANNRKALAFAMRPPADGGLGFDEEKAQTFAKQLVEESSPENVVPHLARIERLVRTFVGDQRHGELHLPAADGVDLALTLIGKPPPRTDTRYANSRLMYGSSLECFGTTWTTEASAAVITPRQETSRIG